jgi:hypothetical protein
VGADERSQHKRARGVAGREHAEVARHPQEGTVKYREANPIQRWGSAPRSRLVVLEPVSGEIA